MERRREYLVQMQPIGRKSDMSRADSFFGMLPAIAPAHSCSPTDGASPLRYALIALQYSSSNSVGPYLQNSRGLPSSPGDLLFGCLRAHRSSVSKPTGRLISGRDPAGIHLRIRHTTMTLQWPTMTYNENVCYSLFQPIVCYCYCYCMSLYVIVIVIA